MREKNTVFITVFFPISKSNVTMRDRRPLNKTYKMSYRYDIMVLKVTAAFVETY